MLIVVAILNAMVIGGSVAMASYQAYRAGYREGWRARADSMWAELRAQAEPLRRTRDAPWLEGKRPPSES